MAKKYYGVRKGITPGIYLSWADCQKNIKGYSGAEYRGFDNLPDALAFVEGGNPQVGQESEESAEIGAQDLESLQNAKRLGAVAYVDGSYNSSTKEYSYGVVLFYQDRTEYMSRKFSDPELATMRNVAGEIAGSMCAMSYCLEHGISDLEIYYDYEGIEKWCTGVWKANKAGTIAYQEFYKRASKTLKVHFVKVKGHSGDKYNDLADQLAKQALGLA